MSRRNWAGFIRPGYDPLKVPNAPTIGTATAPTGTTAVAQLRGIQQFRHPGVKLVPPRLLRLQLAA